MGPASKQRQAAARDSTREPRARCLRQQRRREKEPEGVVVDVQLYFHLLRMFHSNLSSFIVLLFVSPRASAPRLGAAQAQRRNWAARQQVVSAPSRLRRDTTTTRITSTRWHRRKQRRCPRPRRRRRRDRPLLPPPHPPRTPPPHRPRLPEHPPPPPRSRSSVRSHAHTTGANMRA